MKKTLSLLGIMILTVGLVGAAYAGGPGCSKTAQAGCEKSAEMKTAATGGCPATAAKAAYAASFEQTHCEQTAKLASYHAMSEAAYANALAEKGCEESAAKAAYAYVKEQTGYDATACEATQHAVAQAAYTKCLAETGCEATAKAKYDATAKEVGQKMAQHLEQKGAEEKASS